MPGTKRKAESQLDVAQTAANATTTTTTALPALPALPSLPALPALPALPGELWTLIFDHARLRGGDMAQLRLVNKRCAGEFAYRLYAEKLRSQFAELKQKRLALVARRHAQITGTGDSATLQRHCNTTFGHGMLMSDAGFQQVLWTLICLYHNGAYDDALRLSRFNGTQGRIAPVKMCIEAMRTLLQDS